MSTNERLSTWIVHDLRNPVAAICTAAELLIDIHHGERHVKRLATNIFHAAGRMRELLADLRSIACGNAPAFENCNIRDVIVAAAEAASAVPRKRKVRILLEVPDSLEVPLIRPHMERVFFNLISNSLEAMPSGGKLHIACREAGKCALIEFEDTGPGIAHAIRDRLFEPFVTAGKQDGLGLGLALSRQAIRDHSGDMWMESAKGARFVIRLPLHRRTRPIEELNSEGRPQRPTIHQTSESEECACTQTDMRGHEISRTSAPSKAMRLARH
jgi:signal transduction histidine kinase